MTLAVGGTLNPNTTTTKRAVQPQKMARGLKFWISEVEGLYYSCSKNKGAVQLTAHLNCAFVLAYAKSRVFFITRLI